MVGQKQDKVVTIGAMNTMGKDYEPKVWLDTISNKTHLYGMGPYDRMKGEIMVFDGKPFYASAFVEGKAQVGVSWDIYSPFFFYSNVNQWEVFDLDDSISSVTELQKSIEALAKRNGYNLDKPFPFRIKGIFDEITLHIVTPRNPDVEGYIPDRKQQVFDFEQTPGELLGFYSQHHEGIFTHGASFMHVHFISDDYTFMGHVDKLISNGTLKLYLPVNN